MDAFGHISVRNPVNSKTFFLSRNLAPALISTREDFVEYSVDNAEPVDSGAPKGYSERHIHSEILKRFPAVNSVVHSHSPDVLPYCVNDVPLKPTIHMAGFLGSEVRVILFRGLITVTVGTEVPVFDISHHYRAGDIQDYLVRNVHLGEALASSFTKSQAAYAKVGASIVNRITGSHTEDSDEPDQSVVLMRGHGFTTAASSIEHAVYQAIYTQTAAKVQTTALLTQNAHFGAKLDGKIDDSGNIRQASIKPGQKLHYLASHQELRDASAMNQWVVGRSWPLWEREISVLALYVNDVKPDKTEPDLTV